MQQSSGKNYCHLVACVHATFTFFSSRWATLGKRGGDGGGRITWNLSFYLLSYMKKDDKHLNGRKELLSPKHLGYCFKTETSGLHFRKAACKFRRGRIEQGSQAKEQNRLAHGHRSQERSAKELQKIRSWLAYQHTLPFGGSLRSSETKEQKLDSKG